MLMPIPFLLPGPPDGKSSYLARSRFKGVSHHRALIRMGCLREVGSLLSSGCLIVSPLHRRLARWLVLGATGRDTGLLHGGAEIAAPGQ
jgi:hypothetical protein